MKRRTLQGLVTVVRFNWHFYAVAAAALAALVAAAVLLGPPWRSAPAVAAALACLATVGSLLATAYAYDFSGFYRLEWLDPAMEGVGTVANIHAGFDETTGLLRAKYPDCRIEVLDFYDPEVHTEVSIRRARRACPPTPETRSVTTTRLPLAEGSVDRVLLILAAHEIRDDAERVAFLLETRRILRPGGRIVVAEHLRDLPNLFAYHLGAWHFHPRATWEHAFRAAGLHRVAESHPNRLITVFTLAADGMDP